MDRGKIVLRNYGGFLIKAVSVENFRGIQKLAIPFGRVTVLVGPNNAGKSSFLQAIQFSVSISQSLELHSAAKPKLSTFAGSLSPDQLLYTPIRNVYSLAHGGVLTEDERRKIKVVFEFEGEKKFEVEAKKGRNKNIATSIAPKNAHHSLKALDPPFSIIAPGLAGIAAFEEFKSPGIVRRAAARGDANNVFRNILLILSEDSEKWEQFKHRLNLVFPDLSINVSFSKDSDEHIEVTTRRGWNELPIDSSGTGVLQTIQILAYIGVYSPKLLILDEPDSHLHPDNQRKLARLLNTLAKEENFQILISTHSSHFFDEFEDLEATTHWIGKEGIVEGEFERVDALMMLGAMDVKDRLRNGALKAVVITEDSELSLIKAVLESSGFMEGEYDVLSYKSSSKIDSAIILSQFIREHAPETKVIIHRDRDFVDNDVELFIQASKEHHFYGWVTEGSDIESYFIREDFVRSQLNAVEAESLSDCLKKSIETARTASIEKAVNSINNAENRRRNNEAGYHPKSTGQVSTMVYESYEADPVGQTYGKKTLAALKGHFHEIYKRSFSTAGGHQSLGDVGLRAFIEQL
ncbi:AAA family ATPase [Leucobacter sp. M11]|uniref:AAA family ATPase n=1 Tax=Leucobacter sp. M11 TaxID=2993565 RepID=UPI002D80CC9E|nr:AAA family ATPase [Leucobacter sp. M11]MEB4613496.1 AAA family ATPase [Leucobacter sp. M11]